MAREQIDEVRAIGRIISGNRTVQEELSRLAVLIEYAEARGRPRHPNDASDPLEVEEWMREKRDDLMADAIRRVVDRNSDEITQEVQREREQHPEVDEETVTQAVVKGREEYRQDLEGFLRFGARHRVIEELDRQDPSLKLAERVARWLRDHQRLVKTTARKEIITEYRLNYLTLDLRYDYQATGGKKRYHLLYTPSRVDLGKRERESVEKWAQWIGGYDRAAARGGRRLYGLINKSVRMYDSLTEPELLKTGENASMVSHFAFSNAMALMVNATARGDVEEMGDQMGLREDRKIHPAGEGYGGYCIPKDGLFLEFVLVLTRPVKLRQLGIPDRFHDGVVRCARTLLALRDEFPTEVEWEDWAAMQITNREELRQMFGVREGGDGGLIPVFQMTKIARAIGRLGRPDVEDGVDRLITGLSARWGIHKMVVGGEQVNRFMPFFKVWLTYRAIEEGRRLKERERGRNRVAGDPGGVSVGMEEAKQGWDRPGGEGSGSVRWTDGLGEGANPVGWRQGGMEEEENDEEKNNVGCVDDFTVVLTAEYKPDTQDGRYAVGMRKYEVFAGTYDHLLYALDLEGQDLALLMRRGFVGLGEERQDRLLRCLGSDPADQEQIERMRAMFPGYPPPGEIRVVSPMGLSTQDLLHYTSDTALDAIAEDVRQRLLRAGLTESEIWANVQTYGARLRQWARLDQGREALIDEIGGAIHALTLKIRGPERHYEEAVQGADVLDVGIPHTSLLNLLDDPGRLRDLMLLGNPNSALVLVDGTSGARRRAMTPLGVMGWFAAGERAGRTALYIAIGVGRETVEVWREEMRRRRGRAERLFETIARGDVEQAKRLYDSIRDKVREEQEAQLAADEEEKLIRFGKATLRDRFVTETLARIAGGLRFEQLTFVEWLALGGMFILDGEPKERIERYRKVFEEVMEKVRAGERESGRAGEPPFPHSPILPLREEETGMETGAIWLFIKPKYTPKVEGFRQEKRVESSNKATEERVQVAIDTRRELELRAAKARSLNAREEGFRQAYAEAVHRKVGFEEGYTTAMRVLGDGTMPLTHADVGRFLGYTKVTLSALVHEVYPADDPEGEVMIRRFDALIGGRAIDLQRWREIAGGYEDIGDFGRMAQRVVEDRNENAECRMQNAECNTQAEHQDMLEKIAQGAELFYIVHALEVTSDDVQPLDLWRNLANFFAETMNDHFYEYRPWVYSRGIGFDDYRGDAMYDLAVRRHIWLYRYLRRIIVTRTDVRYLSEEDHDALLGNFLGGKAIVGIGADGETSVEQAWRAYGQLREITFIRNDRFPIPEVFRELDPDIIDADHRVNQVILLPVGRTHYSRVLMEGPTLARELAEEGRMPSNLIITRDGWFEQIPGTGRRCLMISSGHLYVSKEQYRKALIQHKGYTAEEAQREAEEKVGPKGTRVAARFTRPIITAIVYPFHGHPKYTSGLFEDEGLPYSVQSLFHTWTTYDKAKYPDVFDRESGVEIPGEIDWLRRWTEELDDEGEVKRRIEYGDPERGYSGLRSFAERHRLVMVKDAAESGGRNQKAFVLRETDREVDGAEIQKAVDFIYQISLKQNVAIQEVIIASPEYWATEEFMRSFVERQIVEWGSRVERRRRPRTPIYGSHRIIMSTGNPLDAGHEGRWHISHQITLNSKQLITNIGRGGTLEEFRPELIREEFRATILKKLFRAGELTMEALARYEEKAGGRYEQEGGRKVGRDLMGVSYGVPRYMMLDFLIAPVFAEEGEIVDVEPRYNECGERIGSRIILQHRGHQFEGTIVDWRVVLIEPNIGVGLWDRLALREEAWECAAAVREKREINWDAIGQNGRIIVKDLARAGEDYLMALS
ncbi:MAG: hypothetical protein HY709_01635 [Candidatus Latescibacteria bacterium]|nr:hypothetical protein [Candidatus Latescibacterota bacterium]